jgi:hypothetical protein
VITDGGLVFISYRRTDSGGHAGRIYHHLKTALGPERVFIDTAFGEPGQNYLADLQANLARAATVLVVIGPDWLDVRGPDGGRRLDNPEDLVRYEVQTALALGKRVIPVLVGGANMPRAQDLPGPLAGLHTQRAASIRHETFDQDAAKLIAAVVSAERRRRLRRWLALAVAVGASLAGGLAWSMGTRCAREASAIFEQALAQDRRPTGSRRSMWQGAAGQLEALGPCAAPTVFGFFARPELAQSLYEAAPLMVGTYAALAPTTDNGRICQGLQSLFQFDGTSAKYPARVFLAALAALGNIPCAGGPAIGCRIAADPRPLFEHTTDRPDDLGPLKMAAQQLGGASCNPGGDRP